MSRITRNSLVTLAYTVLDAEGTMVDEGKEPLCYLHGGYNAIFLPVEVALHGKTVGESITVKLQPADAFGEYDPELVDIVSVSQLPHPLAVGMQIEASPQEWGDDERFYVTVTDIADGKAVLDGNHPLAGIALVFTGTVEAIRSATVEEIEVAMARNKK